MRPSSILLAGVCTALSLFGSSYLLAEQAELVATAARQADSFRVPFKLLWFGCASIGCGVGGLTALFLSAMAAVSVADKKAEREARLSEGLVDEGAHE